MWKLKVAEGGKQLMTVSNHIGRQHWEFDPDAGTPEERAEVERLRRDFTSNRFLQKQSSDVLMRMQMRKEKAAKKPILTAVKLKSDEDVTEMAVETALRRGLDYLCSIQAHDGHWPSDIAGPLFLMPPLVMALYITKALNTVLPYEHQKEIKRYIYNHQNEDGGWGLHIEGNSIMFCSALSYVALRLLGDDLENDVVSRGQKWILDHGSALGTPSWGKFWLAVLGVYEWDGCNPIPPEFWLLPQISPFHPEKMMCHCRVVYMRMSYLYGKRFVGKITPLIQQIRKEIYHQQYHQINWNLARYTFAKEDLCYPHPLAQDMLWGFLYHVGEPILKVWPFSKLRKKAIDVAMEHIHYEDVNSRYINFGCFEKILSLMACWVEDPQSEAYKLHLARIPDFLWVDEDGMKLQSIGSQTWDTSMAIQTIMLSDFTQEYQETLYKAHAFIRASQVKKNPSENFEKMYRRTSKGAWTFTTPDHGLQVSDCTAEALKDALLYSQMPKEIVGDHMKNEQLYDSINFLLTLQSENGGYTAWEPQRGYRWVEKFNPTEFLEGVVIEKEHVECTSAVVQCLVIFKTLHPEHRRQEIEICIEKALKYILDKQNPDGSWTGDWFICYCPGTWLAVEALVSCGMNYKNSPPLRKACNFLLSKQLDDGGWGESHLSCKNKIYTNIEGNRSHLVQTSWALLSLIKAGQFEIDPTPINKGIKLLINSQLEKDGDFPQQEMVGIFYKTGCLSYAIYRNIFPLRALGEYRKCVQLS